MRFEFAWIWLLAPLLLAYAWWLSRRSYAQLEPRSRWISLFARLCVLLLLVAAASRPAWQTRSTVKHVVFALDVSRSVTSDNVDAMLADVDRLSHEAFAAGDARVSVVAFGQDASLVVHGQSKWNGWDAALSDKLRYAKSLPGLYADRTRLISANNDKAATADGLDKLQRHIAEVEQFRDRVAGQRTDVESGLRLALNCGSAGEQSVIYLFTDGNFNQGRWQQAWSAAGANTTPIHTVALDKPQPPEVAAADLALPSNVRVNQGFSADLRIASTVDTKAEMHVFKDGYAEPPREIELKRGENQFKIPGLFFREKGMHAVEVSLRPTADTELANNTIRSLVVVPGEARVLYVDADEKQAPYLKSALELEGMNVEPRPASGVPQSLSELLSFDAFILCNVPADRMSLSQMQMIRTYVQDFGGGFIMLGGDESFGLGGYYNTPIEEILPVRMPIQKDMLRPSLALMLVIDKSGSMDGVKIQLAKRAAISSAEAINPRDLIGVIGFDSESRVLLELTPAADRSTINSHIATLDAGGGTFLYPGLDDAHRRLSESNARRKHVIVLSDGQTEGSGYEEQASTMAADGITISTVGIGDGADMNLLDAIAVAAGGRSYFTNDFYSIPQIFTREALRASRNMLVERMVQPVAVGSDPATDEIDTTDLPVLTGYVATTAKPAANMILTTDTGDPLLAKWRYGLGRTAAFTSEPKPRWAEDWLEWDDFAKFWSQLVRSVTSSDQRAELSVECSHNPLGAGVRLVADVRDASNAFADATSELSLVSANGRSTKVRVERTAPGLFEAILPEITYGADQNFAWRFSTGRAMVDQPRATSRESSESESGLADSQENTTSYGFVYSFSPEFGTLGPAADVLSEIQLRGAGEAMSVGNAKLVLPSAYRTDTRELWPALLIAALLLVPIDILIRRVG